MFRLVKNLFLVATLFSVLFSCTLSPQDKVVEDLVPKFTKIDTPENIRVMNNHLSDTISITWDPVENATYYTVEYQRVSDYLESRPAHELIVNTNSADISVPEGNDINSRRDKRYIFRIKASYVERDGGRNIISTIDSEYSRQFEGVIADYLTVTYIKQNNVLSVFDTSSKVTSILNDGEVASIEVKYFDEPYHDGKTEVDPANEIDTPVSISLESGKTYSFTAALYADGALTALTGFDARADVDYNPPPVTDLSAENNLRDHIKLSWSEVSPSGGVDAVVRYSVEKKVSDSSEWQPVMDDDGSGNVLLLDRCEFTDADAESDTDYDYKVLSVYVLNSDGSMIMQSDEDAATVENCHKLDTKPSSFKAKVMNVNIPEYGGPYKAQIELSWGVFHEDIMDVDGLEFRITRHISGMEDEYSVLVADSATYTDTIELEADGHPFDLTYYYTIEYIHEDIPLSLSGMSASDENGMPFFHTVEGTLEKIEYIKSFSASGIGDDNPPYADKILIEWTLNDLASMSEGNLDIGNVELTLSRRETTSVDAVIMETFSGQDALENSYEDKNSVPGVEYVYQLTASYKKEGDIHNGQTHTLSSNGRRLSSPENFTASMNTSSSSVDLSWEPVENAAGYRIMYREEGSGDEYALLLETSLPSADSASVLVQDGKIRAGYVYEFYIQSCDEYDPAGTGRKYSLPSPVVKGCVLGCLPLEVENGANYIRIRWNEAENVSMYRILVFNEDGRELYRTQTPAGVTSFVLKADDLPEDIIIKEEYPLSMKYKFTVVPGNAEISEYVFAEGSWITPPVKIKATKADYRDIIEITWEGVGDGYSYVVYRRPHGSNSAWSFVEYTGGTRYSYLTTNEEYDFSVASVKDGVQGPVQAYFVNDGNHGYPLMKPDRVGASDYGNNLFQIYFSQVKGATEYKVEVEGNVYSVTDSQIADAPSSVSVCEDGTLTVDSSGMVWLYVRKVLPVRKLTWDVFVSAVNENAAYSDKNSTEPVALAKLYNESSLTNTDYVNVIFNNLHDIVSSINNYYEGDWWPNSREYYEGGNITSYTCSDFKWTSPKEYGNITFADAQANDLRIDGSLTCYVDDNLAHLTSDDPLRRISGDLTVVLPYNYPSFRISFSEHPVTGSGISQISISRNGSAINDITSVPVLLQEE